MPDPATLAFFAVAALALIVVPGPAVLYVVSQGIEAAASAGSSRRSASLTGGLVHVSPRRSGSRRRRLVCDRVQRRQVGRRRHTSSCSAAVACSSARAVSRGLSPGRGSGRGGGSSGRARSSTSSTRRRRSFSSAFLPQFVDVDHGAVGSRSWRSDCSSSGSHCLRQRWAGGRLRRRLAAGSGGCSERSATRPAACSSASGRDRSHRIPQDLAAQCGRSRRTPRV